MTSGHKTKRVSSYNPGACTGLRPTGHSYRLPECRLQLGKNACIIRCLYRYAWWWCSIAFCFVSFSVWL